MLREAGIGQEGRSRRPSRPQQLAGPQERSRPTKSGRLGKIERAKIVERAREAFSTSRYREAESLFRQLLRGAGAEPVDAVCGLSAIRRAWGRPAEAASLVEQARRYHRDDPSLRRELGYIAYDQRRYEDAAGIFAELVQEYPLSSRSCTAPTAMRRHPRSSTDGSAAGALRRTVFPRSLRRPSSRPGSR
jgi:tetratricopeptide (TPR) repeat protein